MDAKELAHRLGVSLRTEEHHSEKAHWPTEVEVRFFREGDPAHTFVGRDGERIPRGVPVERFRKTLAEHDGVFTGPHGTRHLIRIPDHVRDGHGFFVSVTFTSMKPEV